MNGDRAVAAAIAGELVQRKTSIADMLPTHINPERFIKAAMVAIARDVRVQRCTRDSIVESVIKGASLGLEVGSVLGEAYLVAYGTTCQLIPGYRGMIGLARRSGQIVAITAQVVYEKDEFGYSLGIHPTVSHKPYLGDDPGAVIAVYAGATLKDGGDQLVILPKWEIEKIRARSKASGSGPWVTDWGEMAKKTGIRRLFKMLPVSTEQLSQALELQARSEADFSEEALTALAADQVSADAANKAAADAAAKAAADASGTLLLEGGAE